MSFGQFQTKSGKTKVEKDPPCTPRFLNLRSEFLFWGLIFATFEASIFGSGMFHLQQYNVACSQNEHLPRQVQSDLDWTLIKGLRWLFLILFLPLLLTWATNFAVAWSLSLIDSSLKSNPHIQVKLVQIPETLGRSGTLGSWKFAMVEK